VRRLVPPSQAQAALIRVDQVGVSNDLGVCRRIHPCVVGLGVAVRRSLARGERTDLEREEGAGNLEVELIVELRGGDSQVALHAIPLGRADLTDPAILKDRQRRQQYEQHPGEERQARRSAR